MANIMNAKDASLPPGLYVVATPIGNLGDITYRAVDTLKNADLIVCEDTRHTAKLCAAYSISTPREPYHEHNAARVRPRLIKKLQDGARICLVSDAGTPLISDPGFKLVREAREAGVSVTPIPGASALITALSAAGAPSDRFLFAGFPPSKAGERQRFFEDLASVDGTLIFYESPGRLAASLAAMTASFGERSALVARELTKKFEEFRRGSLSELAQDFAQSPAQGEIVVIVEPLAAKEAAAIDLDGFLREALADMSVREAAAAAAEMLGVRKKRAYDRALELKEK